MRNKHSPLSSPHFPFVRSTVERTDKHSLQTQICLWTPPRKRVPVFKHHAATSQSISETPPRKIRNFAKMFGKNALHDRHDSTGNWDWYERDAEQLGSEKVALLGNAGFLSGDKASKECIFSDLTNSWRQKWQLVGSKNWITTLLEEFFLLFWNWSWNPSLTQ